MTQVNITQFPPKNNFTAAVAPTTTDDTAAGYSQGSRWLDSTTEIIWTCVDATASAAVWAPNIPYMGVTSSSFITPGIYEQRNSVAYAVALDTTISLLPFFVTHKTSVVSLGIRTITGAALSAAKLALWRHSYTTMRPTGLAFAGSNTGQATTGSNSTAAISITTTLHPNVIYWFGAAVTAAAPTFLSVGGNTAANNTWLGMSLGLSAMANTALTGVSAPYAYSGDIMAKDLTSETFTRLAGDQGIPVPHLGT